MAVQFEYVIEFKLLRFEDGWNRTVPATIPERVEYRAAKKAALRVVCELVPGQVQTLLFMVPADQPVIVSVPENLVFISKLDAPPKPEKGIDSVFK